MCIESGTVSCPMNRSVGNTQNNLTNYELVSMCIKAKSLGNSVGIHS